MPTWSWIAIAVVAVVLVVLALICVAAMSRHKRSERLQDQFGPEYERTVDTAGGQRAAEKELIARERQHKKLDITELTPESRARYAQEWGATQAAFVDNPTQAVSDADRLVTEVMRERGYPIEDFEQQAAHVSVDHPKVVEHYRAAHILHLAQDQGDIGTEAQREALVHYRALFEQLLTTGQDTGHDTGHDSPREARA